MMHEEIHHFETENDFGKISKGEQGSRIPYWSIIDEMRIRPMKVCCKEKKSSIDLFLAIVLLTPHNEVIEQASIVLT